MVVVIAVILILVGLVLPAATSMWNQRRISEAHNTVQSLLRTTRAKAFGGEYGDMGLFFYVDAKGVQHIATIARNPLNPDDPPLSAQARPNDSTLTPEAKWRTDRNWRDVFTITGDRSQAMPPTMRVVPRYTIDVDTGGAGDPEDYEIFSKEELANENFSTLVADAAQRHRNFFSIVFSADGKLMPKSTVLIRDRDESEADTTGYGFGDVTGLPVTKTNQNASRYYSMDGATPAFATDPEDPAPSVDHLIVERPDATTAVNFHSIDGLLVYDDSLFREAATPAGKRQVLIDTAQPFYVHHLTGTVVKGPSGENQAPTP